MSHNAYREANERYFEEGHAFIGYQKDTPAAVVFQATNLLEKLVSSKEGVNNPIWKRLSNVGVLKDIKPSDFKEEGGNSQNRNRAVSLQLLFCFCIIITCHFSRRY